VELSRNRSATQEVFVSHANAALTPRARLRLARLIVDQGWPVARAAERYDVSWPTAKRWADRYAVMGEAGMANRSSRPHRSPSPTPAPVLRRIVHLRWRQRLGPVEIADQVGVAASTVYAVLVRCRLNRLSHVDRVSGEPVRRYEHPTPARRSPGRAAGCRQRWGGGTSAPPAAPLDWGVMVGTAPGDPNAASRESRLGTAGPSPASRAFVGLVACLIAAGLSAWPMVFDEDQTPWVLTIRIVAFLSAMAGAGSAAMAITSRTSEGHGRHPDGVDQE
jgi:hypothetical protein